MNIDVKNILSQIKSVKRLGNKRKSVSNIIKNKIKNTNIKSKINTIKEYALSDYTIPVIGHGELNIDVSDHGNKIEVKVEIPGVPEENIKLTAQDNNLIIHVEKKSETQKNPKNYYLMECSYGSFMRTIPLPFKINNDKVTANLEKGVLTILIAKPSNHENIEKVIEIKKKK